MVKLSTINIKWSLFLFFFTGTFVSYTQVISAGYYHSRAVCSDNTAWTWGGNSFAGIGGALGDGTTTNRSSPVQPIGMTGVTAVGGGGGGLWHSHFIKNNGIVWGTGLNGRGDLGDGTTTNRTTPIQTIVLTGITAVAGGEGHSVYLKIDGTVWASGKNLYGDLGDGTSADRFTPVQTLLLTGVTSVGGGENHSLFGKSDGTAWSCGKNGSFGSNAGYLGDGTSTHRYTPVQVVGITGVSAVSGGVYHSLFLKNDGTVWACGDNSGGQTGDGTSAGPRLTVVQVSGLTGITAISGGGGHSLFLKNDGTVWGCGYNGTGQLGDGTTTTRLTPVQVSGLTGITAIAAGGDHSLFARNDGTIWACGQNNLGQLGDGTSTGEGTTTYRTTPIQTLVFGGSGPGSCNVVVLPVELLSFTANPYQGHSVLCNWATASEINNDYFTLEKSKDGISFSPFANINGAGNSSISLSYQYIDADPYMGLSYYRLKQTDFNGSFSYSNIRSVFFGNIDLISVFPNPATDYIFYTVASENGGPVILKLYDVLGREVLSKEESIEKGVAVKQLSIASLCSGSYILRLVTSEQEKVQKQFVVK